MRIFFLIVVSFVSLLGSQKNLNIQFKKEIESLKKDISSLSQNQILKQDLDTIVNQIITKKLTNMEQLLSKNLVNSASNLRQQLLHLNSENESKVNQLTKDINRVMLGQIKEDTVKHLINEQNVQQFYKFQDEHRSNILATNSNITYLGSIIVLFGFVITILSFIIGSKLLNKFDKLENDVDSEMDNLKKSTNKNISEAIGRESYIQKTKILEEVKSDFDKYVGSSLGDVFKKKLNGATKDLVKIYSYQNNLFYNNNKFFATKMSEIDMVNDSKKYSEVFRKYNDYYQKISDITSLDKGIMITTLKELAAPSFYPLVNMVSMGEYLEYLYGYDNDEDLRKAIRDVRSRIKT